MSVFLNIILIYLEHSKTELNERERELKKYISCSAARMEDCDFI